MPTKFRLSKDAPGVSLFQPAGGPDAFPVEAGGVVTVPGELAKDQPDDAYVIGEGDEARAWPKALWEIVEDKQPAKAAPVKEN